METVTRQSGILPFGHQSVYISLFRHHYRKWMILLLAASDLTTLVLAALFALSIRKLVHLPYVDPNLYLRLLPVILVFCFGYALYGLYPGIGLNPVEEMRRLTMITTSTFFFLVVISFWAQASNNISRLVLTLFWLFSILGVPAMRWLVRRIAVRTSVWGEPIAVIGSGPQTMKTIEYLRSHAQIGLMPVVLVDGFNEVEQYPEGIFVLHSSRLKEDPGLLLRNNIQTAIIIPGETPAVFQSLIVDNRQFGLLRLVLISSLGWIGGAAITPYDLQGMLGLEIQRKLLDPVDQFCKRFIDMILVVGGGIFALPLIGLIALLIRLESPGGSFYGHRRIGRDGREIKVWKFRTMVKNADSTLNRYLSENPEMRAEWEATQKLRNDPRITRFGKILRRTSMDELPQLWNVLKGEMSLVGPRPIVKDEIKHYGPTFSLYTQVPPGMTGLWQISGRSDMSYTSRVNLDEYYIRRWSIWMDIYVLVRTIWVVIKRSGAY